MRHVGAEKGITVSSSREIKSEGVDVVKVYLVKFQLYHAKVGVANVDLG
jgi:hypothetical protein